MSRRLFFKWRDGLRAFGRGDGTAGVEGTTSGRVDGRGGIAFEDDAFSGLFSFGVGDGDGADEGLGVGV